VRRRVCLHPGCVWSASGFSVRVGAAAGDRHGGDCGGWSVTFARYTVALLGLPEKVDLPLVGGPVNVTISLVPVCRDCRAFRGQLSGVRLGAVVQNICTILNAGAGDG